MSSTRFFSAVVVMMLTLGSLSFSTARSVLAQSLPDGVPTGSVEAEVRSHEDGDKFSVTVGGKTETVLLISADAPEKGECFGDKASSRLKKLIPKGTTIYLEKDKDDRDGKVCLLRYVWLPREDGNARLIDERMVADGYSTFKSREGNTKYDSRLKKVEKKAKSEKRGLWKDCGGGHVEVTPKPKATEVPEVGEKGLPADIGATLETDGQSVTLQEAFFSYDYGYSTPKGGYVFLVMSVRIENVDDSDHGYEEARFKALNAETDAEYEYTFTLADQPLGSGELSPGEFVFGQVVLEVQDTPAPLLVQFDPSYLNGDDEVYWSVFR